MEFKKIFGAIVIVAVIGILILIIYSILPFIPLPVSRVIRYQETAAKIEEKHGLSENIKGYVLEAHGDKMVGFNLQNKRAHTIITVPKELFAEGWRLDKVTGPASSGKIVYLLCNYFAGGNWDSQCVLKMCNSDGSGEIALAKQINTVKDGSDYGSSYEPPLASLAVSPDGKYLALINRVKEEDILNNASTAAHLLPSYGYGFYGTGRLEIYQVPAMRKIKEIAGAVNKGITWFPDSSALIFIGWENSRCVMKKLELSSGSIGYLGRGTWPKISPDARFLIYWKKISKDDTVLYKMNLDDMTESKLSFPKEKRLFEIIAIVNQDLFLYVGVTTGLPERFQTKVQKGCPSLKIGSLTDYAYETLHIIKEEDCGGYLHDLNQELSYGKLDSVSLK